MKLSPEANPRFWIGARCVRASVHYFVYGGVERKFTVVSTTNVRATVVDQDRRRAGTFSMQSYALALARATRKKGATEAMRSVLTHVAHVDQQAAALLTAAEERGMAAFRRRKSRDEARSNARRRTRALDEIRRNADVLSEEEVVTAWREGVVEIVHSS